MRPLLIVLALVAVAAACGGSDESAPPASAGAALLDLDSLDPFVQRFAADRGKPRLLLVFSPT